VSQEPSIVQPTALSVYIDGQFFKIRRVYNQTTSVLAADRLPQSFLTLTFILKQIFSIYYEHLPPLRTYRHLAQPMQIFRCCDLSLDAETDMFFLEG
jgi:hypothetical protein